MKDLHYWVINHPTTVTIHDFNDIYNIEMKILPYFEEIIPLGLLKEKIILKYNNLRIAAKKNGVFSDRMTINSFFYYFSYWDTTRQKVCGPIIILMLKKGECISGILNLIGENDQRIITKRFFNLNLNLIKIII